MSSMQEPALLLKCVLWNTVFTGASAHACLCLCFSLHHSEFGVPQYSISYVLDEVAGGFEVIEIQPFPQIPSSFVTRGLIISWAPWVKFLCWKWTKFCTFVTLKFMLHHGFAQKPVHAQPCFPWCGGCSWTVARLLQRLLGRKDHEINFGGTDLQSLH